MVYDSFHYNPVKDKCPVSSTGFVDLKSAFVNHSLPSQIAGSDENYNGIEDPASILGKPRDVFEAFEMEKHVKEYKPEPNDK